MTDDRAARRADEGLHLRPGHRRPEPDEQAVNGHHLSRLGISHHQTEVDR